MLQHPSQHAPSNRHMDFVPFLIGSPCPRIIGLRLAANAVLEHRKTHVDLFRLTHTVGAVLRNISRSLRTSEVHEVEKPIFCIR